MPNANTSRGNGQVAKPYPDYPLTPHVGGKQWCKKIKGKIYYFGRLSDPQAALDRYLHDRDYLQAGKVPPATTAEGLTIADLANGFLTSKKRMMEGGELQPRSFKDYHDACKMLVAHFGKSAIIENLGPQDFSGFREYLGKDVSLVTLRNRISRCITAFRWAKDNNLLERLGCGTEFKPPSAKALRLERSKKSVKLFDADAIRALLEGAKTANLKAMILLGINCALGNSDISEMQFKHVDLNRGWLVYPRVKTGIERKARLWPETLDVLREVLAKRKAAKDPADGNILFVTKYRQRYIRYAYDVTTGKTDSKDSIGMEFGKLLLALDMPCEGVGFYSLRHTFRTMADNLVGDQRAIDLVMGHKRGDISEVYTHKVDDDRLERVAAAVHDWLLPPPPKPASEAGQ